MEEHKTEWRILPIVDWYVVSSVLIYLLLCSCAVCLLVAVVDAFQRVDEFVDFSTRENYGIIATIGLVAEYYLCLTPQYFIQYMVPFISMLSGIFVVTSMSSNREFTAIRASGISIQRVLFPILLTVFVVAVAVFFLRDDLLPALSREAQSISIKMKPRGGESVTVLLLDEDEKKVYSCMMGHFDPARQVAYNFRLEVRDWNDWQMGKTGEYEVYSAGDAKLVDKTWRLGLHPHHQLCTEAEFVDLELVEDIPTRITPAMLEQATLGMVVMKSSDLAAFSTDIGKQTELARRRAAPFAGVAILLVGISLLLRQERLNPGSQAARVKSVIYAILICAGYYTLLEMTLSLAEDEIFSPNLAAWLPNLTFGAFGGWAYFRTRI
ncbi:MAG: LptF/LptG family permease [Planctomycetes bacterium]|nr:LptF/LptG family permease [Planctomycetota bacterium]